MRPAYATLLVAGLISFSPIYAQTPDQRPAPSIGGGNPPGVSLPPGVTTGASSGTSGIGPSSPDMPDIGLLNDALKALGQSKGLAYDSHMLITMLGQGMSATFRESIHFVSRKPNKYLSDVAQINPNGTVGNHYIVIFDGIKVWIVKPGVNQYDVYTPTEFGDSPFARGLFGGIFGGINMAGVRKLIQYGVSTEGNETDEGRVYDVFNLTGPPTKVKLKLRFLIDPQTDTIRQITARGQGNGLDITFTETVTDMELSPPVPSAAFRFIPPPGAKRVKLQLIGPS